MEIKQTTSNRVPSVPLITCDPYFSLWAPGDTLYEKNTCHWTGTEKPVYGTAVIDNVLYRFMGDCADTEIMQQVGFDITPTSSRYIFLAGGVEITVTFITPLLLTDLELLSRPCSYIDFSVVSVDEKKHDVSIKISFGKTHCYDGEDEQAMCGGLDTYYATVKTAWMGKAKQSPLNHSGDGITIDWGYLYLAGEKNAEVFYDKNEHVVSGELTFNNLSKLETGYFVVAYDDIASIMYFGEICKGWWARAGKTIIDVICDSISNYRNIKNKCVLFDNQLLAEAKRIGGDDYALVCATAYRQSIAAHKLIADKNGEVVFLSKECYSNGCIGTVDVSYPSVPLYLMYAPELVKGMLRPIFTFAAMDVWPFDFAPHDVGRYPYSNGQIYGTNISNYDNGIVFPPFYLYSKNSDLYNLAYQMPVEECGNMLIMSAAVALSEKCAEYFADKMDVLEKWTNYLIEFGEEPGYQLCTDDFAGHLENNVNLSAKAIMGIYSYSILLKMLGRKDESDWYIKKAKDMAKSWEERASCGDHTTLTFDNKDSWSIKYNTVWDILFESNLFTEQFYDNEMNQYLKMQNKYGTPLDNRKDYTKSDWVAWASIMAKDNVTMSKMLSPIAQFLRESLSRVPFSDWYDTKTGKQCGFQNRTVQGGLFMPLLKEKGILAFIE